MTNSKIRILAICGSLRARSSNMAALQAAQLLAPPEMTITIFDGLAKLPYFNPDMDDENPPDVVAAMRGAVGEADGLLICSPEYARGVAGVLKNGLDWLVGSLEFPNKPVAVINASPRSVHADAALRLTLTTMSARLMDETSILLPLLGRNLDAAEIAADVELGGRLSEVLESMQRFIAGI